MLNVVEMPKYTRGRKCHLCRRATNNIILERANDVTNGVNVVEGILWCFSFFLFWYMVGLELYEFNKKVNYLDIKYNTKIKYTQYVASVVGLFIILTIVSD